jgi:hypothetical protein
LLRSNTIAFSLQFKDRETPLKRLIVMWGLLLAATASAQTKPMELWNQLAEKRAQLPGTRQEFELTVAFRGSQEAFKRTVILEMSHDVWREAGFISSSTIELFDGHDTFRMEEGGDEFVRVKRGARDPAPLPHPYAFGDVDWKQATEVKRLPCALADQDRDCVILRLPMKTVVRPDSNGTVSRVESILAVELGLSTGLVFQATLGQTVSDSKHSYATETTFVLKRLGIGALEIRCCSNCHQMRTK